MPYLGKTPSQGVRARYQFTPNAGTTSLSGADANGSTMTFTDGNYVDVYLNGVMLKAGVDYVTTTANTIGSLAATVASDVVDVIVYDTFSLFGGTLEGNVKVNNGTLNVTGATDLDSTLNVDGASTFGGVLKAPDGSNSAPAYTFSDDTDTGMYSNYANNIAFATGGTVAGIIDANQNMDWQADVNLAHDGAVLRFGADKEVLLTHADSGKLGLTGSLGIGTNNPSTQTHLAKAATTAFSADDASWHDLLISNYGSATSNNVAGIAFQVSADGYASNAGTGICAVKNGTASDYGADLVFITRPQSAVAAERMRIDSSGSVGINTTDGNIFGTSGTSNELGVQSEGTNMGAIIAVGATGTGFSGIDIGTTNLRRGGIYTLDGSHLTFYTNGSNSGDSLTERMRIDSSGNVMIGTTTEGIDTGEDFTIADAAHCGMTIRSGTSSNGNIYFSDGTSGDAEYRGLIRYEHGDDAMFFSAGAAERVRIKSNGDFGVGAASWFQSTSAYKFVAQTEANQICQLNYASNASFTQDVHAWDTIRAATDAFNFFRARTNVGGSPDSEMILQGNGNFLIDGTVTENGADYAEYFEWKDGNSDGEDRVGITVKLDGDKIVPSTSDDNASVIIGVISGKPSVVGDAAWNKWKNKHETDDYGRYVLEEYTFTEWTIPATDTEEAVHHSYPTDYIPSDLTAPSDATVVSKDEDGNKLMRRKLNSSYNPSTTYIPREQRPEWDAVGMMGKLRIRKGQTVGDRWVKMRDVSSSVEEWLVK